MYENYVNEKEIVVENMECIVKNYVYECLVI